MSTHVVFTNHRYSVYYYTHLKYHLFKNGRSIRQKFVYRIPIRIQSFYYIRLKCVDINFSGISSFWVPLFVGQSDFRPLVANKFAWTGAGQPTKQPQSEPKNPSAAAAAMEEAWPPLAPAPEAAAPPGGGGGGGAWGAAAVAQRKEVAEESSAHAVSRLVASCANTSGVAVAVVDANAVISGGAALSSSAARLVTVPEVLEEVRDASARRRLALLMAPVETLDPAPEFVKKGRYYLQQF